MDCEFAPDDSLLEVEEGALSNNSLRILILPKPVTAENQIDLRKLNFVPDGNNRAADQTGEQRDYKRGAQNAILLAQKLFTLYPKDLEVVVELFSQNNVRERSSDSIVKVAAAVLKLAIERLDGEVLAECGISYEGDLEEAYQYALAEFDAKPERSLALLQVIIRLQALNQLFDYQGNKFSLGVNKTENDSTLLFRSGMDMTDRIKSGEVVRTGCQSPQPGHTLTVIGTSTLWPHVTLEEVQGAIQTMTPYFGATLEEGYEGCDILKITDQVRQNVRDLAGVTFVIPYAPDTVLDSLPEIIEDVCFEYVPGNQLHHTQFDFDIALAPGMSQGGVIPHCVRDQNIITCSDFRVALRAIDAVTYHRDLAHLKGADRPPVPERFEDRLAQYDRILQEPQRLQTAEHYRDHPEAYYALGDHFAAQLLKEFMEVVPLTTPPQLRAMINYALTSFFMAYIPQAKGWNEAMDAEIEQFYEMARALGEYMGVVFFADEFLFDYKFSDKELETYIEAGESREAALLRFKGEVANQMIKLIENDEYDVDTEIPDPFPNRASFISILKKTQQLKEKLKKQAHPRAYASWISSMGKLYAHFRDEWRAEVVDDPTVNALVAQEANAKEKYWKGLEGYTIPDFIKEKIVDCIAAIEENRASSAVIADLRLYTYLLKISESIGAGLACKVLVCMLPKSVTISDEVYDLFEEICQRYNLRYRLLNDMAEEGRDFSDREENPDSRELAYRKYGAEHSSLAEIYRGPRDQATQFEMNWIQGIRDLHAFAEVIEQTTQRKIQELAGKAPLLAEMVRRADLAALIYKRGHYRTLELEIVHQLMQLVLGTSPDKQA